MRPSPFFTTVSTMKEHRHGIQERTTHVAGRILKPGKLSRSKSHINFCFSLSDLHESLLNEL